MRLRRDRLVLRHTTCLFAMLVLAICAAEAANPGNGRFKYIKRPVSKYPHHDEDPAAAEQRGDGDETAVPSADGAEGGEVPPPNDSQPPPDAQPPPEGEQPPPGQQPSQEEPNQTPRSEDGGSPAQNPDGGSGGMQPDPFPFPSDSMPPQDGFPPNDLQPDGGFSSETSVQYTNELGEPVPNYSTLTPSVYSVRRTMTTTINGRRYRIPNIRRGWNRQTVLSAGD